MGLWLSSNYYPALHTELLSFYKNDLKQDLIRIGVALVLVGMTKLTTKVFAKLFFVFLHNFKFLPRYEDELVDIYGKHICYGQNRIDSRRYSNEQFRSSS